MLIELARYGEKPVGELEAIRLADRLGARTYVESSALTQRNLKEVFDEAIVAALSSNEDLRRLTAASSSGRSRTGNRLLNSIRENWRLSQSSGSTERGGLLLRCSLRRSKMADNNISSSSTSSSNSTKQQPKKNPNDNKKPSLWKRLFCCLCCSSAWITNKKKFNRCRELKWFHTHTHTHTPISVCERERFQLDCDSSLFYRHTHKRYITASLFEWTIGINTQQKKKKRR